MQKGKRSFNRKGEEKEDNSSKKSFARSNKTEYGRKPKYEPKGKKYKPRDSGSFSRRDFNKDENQGGAGYGKKTFRKREDNQDYSSKKSFAESNKTEQGRKPKYEPKGKRYKPGDSGSFSRRSFNKDENQGDTSYGKRTFRKRENSSEKKGGFEYGKTMKPQRRPDYGKERLANISGPKVKTKILKEKKDELIRLNKFIANAGLCSRREADLLIESGQITVNGKVVTEMGYKVMPIDVVKYGRKILNKEKLVYILLNKPKDYITTTDDPKGRKTVMELIKIAGPERVYPVGRLDRGTTGLLMFTNDGELTEKLSHPSHEIKKIYQAEIDKPITNEDFEKLINGLELEDGFIKPNQVSIITPDRQVIGLEIHSGKNRIVRRIFEHLNYEVTQLDRTTFAGLTKKGLIRGNWRYLTEKEVIRLKYLI